MPNLADDPEYRLTLRQADQAREDFGAILDELDFLRMCAGTNARVAQPHGVDGLRHSVGVARKAARSSYRSRSAAACPGKREGPGRGARSGAAGPCASRPARVRCVS